MPFIAAIGYWSTASFQRAFVLTTLSLASDIWAYATTSTATPDGPLHIAVFKQVRVSGEALANEPSYNTPTNPTDKAFVNASTVWTDDLKRQLPSDWKVRGPFEWEMGGYKYMDDHTKLPYVAPAGEMTIPDSAIPDRKAVWLPYLVKNGLIVVGLLLAALLFKSIVKSGPFDAKVYQLLRAIALVGILGSFLVDQMDMTMLNDFYSQLDLARFGIAADRDSGSLFNPRLVCCTVSC